MFEDITLNNFMEKIMEIGWIIIKFPIEFYYNLPGTVKTTILTIILLFAIFLFAVTFKLKNAWRSRR